MLRNKRLWWAAALSIIAWLWPGEGFSIERDPYMFRTLIGRITLEYEKVDITAKNGAPLLKTTRFEQVYSLDLRGNILSRRLIIYDAGASYSNTDFKLDSTKNNSRLIDYHLRTTILPRSSIPLTLYASRNELTTSTMLVPTTITTYGLNWLIRGRTLPVTILKAEKINDKGDHIDTRTTNYGVNMVKELTNSYNELDYTNTKQDQRISDSTITQSTINAKNDTRISANTRISLGATRSVVNNPALGNSTANGLSLSLTSKPSEEFNQMHQYTIFRTRDRTGLRDGRFYNGEMNYRASRRVTSRLALDVNDTSDKTATDTGRAKTVDASGNVSYAVTNNLAASETVIYSQTKTSSTSGQSNLGDRTLFKAITALNYRRTLSWAQFTGHYSIGFVEDRAPGNNDGKGGKGIEQSVSFELGNINFNKYVGFNTGASYSRVKTVAGRLPETHYSYHLDAFNKVGKKYVDMRATYQKKSGKSFLESLTTKTEITQFDAVSNYFKNTRLSFTFNRTNTLLALIGFTGTSSKIFTASHNRVIYKGNFTALARYTLSKNFSPGSLSNTDQKELTMNYSRRVLRGLVSANMHYILTDYKLGGGVNRTKDAAYTLSYSRVLLSRVLWQLLLERTETKTNNLFRNTSTIQNNLSYALRAWLFTLEHRYSLVSDQTGSDITQTSILFRASRTFIRIF